MRNGRFFEILFLCGLHALWILSLSIPAYAASERTAVTVITSFPSSFYEPFREGFEAAQDRYRLRILNKKTSAAVAHVLEPSRQPVDVFWASAPDAFEVLAAAGRLARLTPREIDAPSHIARYPIDDPAGAYLGFALAGYGLVWNEDYLHQAHLSAPQRLEDLRQPAYHGHLGICAPSRSGTTHLMVETVLQKLGWEEGWATWLEIGGNLATITARSYGVSDGVAKGRFGIGITIDFLGRSAGSLEGPTRFAYPADNVFLPASVAIVEDAPNRPGAEAFIDFLLSQQAQRLLLRPDILRLPILPSLYDEAPAGYTNPYAATASSTQRDFVFDAALSGRRYELVNLLFDELITYRLYELQKAWAAIHEAEARLRQHPNADAERLVAQARERASALPITAEEAADPAFTDGLRRQPRGVPVSARQARLEAEWRTFARENLEIATGLAEIALGKIEASAPGPELRP